MGCTREVRYIYYYYSTASELRAHTCTPTLIADSQITNFTMEEWHLNVVCQSVSGVDG